MDERLLETVVAGVDLFLAECCEESFASIALREAPTALGWARWKEIEETYFLGLVRGALDALASDGSVGIPAADMTARMFLAALDEAGLAVSNSPTPRAECESARHVALQFLRGLGLRAG
jgi:hypothetical protein